MQTVEEVSLRHRRATSERPTSTLGRPLVRHRIDIQESQPCSGEHTREENTAGEARPDAGGSGADRVSDDASAKPDSPGDLTKTSWLYVARKTVREFSDDQCTDLAAA